MGNVWGVAIANLRLLVLVLELELELMLELELAHGVGILWSNRVHQRGHVWHARDLADGRQHVLRWA